MVHHIPPIAYEEKEYKTIMELKSKLGSNWHDFILDLVRFYNSNSEAKHGHA